ncbi:MAG: hypothetical protein U0T84_07280 [Chitinophagales bacterium]
MFGNFPWRYTNVWQQRADPIAMIDVINAIVIDHVWRICALIIPYNISLCNSPIIILSLYAQARFTDPVGIASL